MLVETVYNGRSNTIDLLLKADGSAVDLSAVTKMEIVDKKASFTTISSETSPDAFDWTTGTTGKIVLALGDEAIPAGKYYCNLIVYDATMTDGLIWGEFALYVI